MLLQARNKGEFYWFVLIMMIWGRTPLLGYVKAVFLKVSALTPFAEFVLPILFVAAIIASGHYWKKHLSKNCAIVFVLIELVAFLHLGLYPDNIVYAEKYYVIFAFLTVPLFLVGSQLNINRIEKPLYVISIISVLVQVAYFFVYGGRGAMSSGGVTEDMALSYQILPHVVFTSWQALKNNKLIQYPVPILGVFLMLSLGSRGPVVALISFWLLYLLLIKLKESIWVKVAVVGLAGLMIRFIDYIIVSITSLILHFGLSTRIFDFIEQEEFNDQNGRDFIRTKLLEHMQNAPIFGYGLGGDRKLIGHYSHNLFLEIVVSFGWFLGGVVCLLIVALIIKSYMRASNEKEKAFLIVLFSCGFMSIMFSGSFLDEGFFFLLLGYCIFIINRRKKVSL